MSSCPCGLTKDDVKFLHSENQVLLVGGKCQNPYIDGSDGICGKALGAHPLVVQGNVNYISVLCYLASYLCFILSLFYFIMEL
jgi:hypothetical protein